MRRGRPHPRTWAAAPAAVLLACMCSCSGSADGGAVAPSAAAAASSTAAALSSAAQASPGAYGSPADPSLPNPTEVAVDPTTPPAAPVVGSSSDVVVTYSGWVDQSSSVEVGAYVAGVVESGGTCTLTLTGPGPTRTTAVTGEADAGSTSCPTMTVPGTRLSSGSWTAVVAYASTDTSGTSASVTVDVP